MTIASSKTTQAELNFLKYVRTKELINYKKINTGVHISQKEIEDKFFTYPEFNRKKILDELELENKLKITKGKYFRYHCVIDGDIDLDLLKPTYNYAQDNDILKAMRGHLSNVSTSFNGKSTIYFDTFMQHKETHLNHFFKVDNFARRIHTPITNLPKIYRDHLLLYDVETASLDVAQMQPLLLSRLLYLHVGNNEFSNMIKNGKDVYIELQRKAKLKTRKEAKKLFFEILFGKPSNELADVFGGSNWIKWINGFKQLEYKENPRTNVKRHSNLAHLLQSAEVRVMYDVWKGLCEEQIAFVTVHDEIIVQYCNVKDAERIMNKVLDWQFKSYKINISKIDEIKYSFKLNNYQIEKLIENQKRTDSD